MRYAILATLVAATILTGCAAREQATDADAVDVEMPEAGGSDSDEPSLSSLSLIDIAMNEGRIDYSTGMLYKTFSLFDPMSLPPEYESSVPSKGGTAVILEVQRNWNRLAPDDRAEIGLYIEPIGQQDDETSLDDVTPDRLEHERTRLD